MRKASNKIHKVVFVRHGESEWNKANRFTGWHDVKLTENGYKEAQYAGELLKKKKFTFDLAFTSVLTRAIVTYNTIASELNCHWIPVERSWRLNERHYGALQGLNKAETAEKHGPEQVLIWRRSYDIPPPELADDDQRNPKFDPRYAHVPEDLLPKTESLKLTVDRVLPYWYDAICPQVMDGKNVIVVAHGNSIRAIYKHLTKISNEEILNYNVPTASPLVFEFDSQMKPIKNYYLESEEKLKARMEAVANQAQVGTTKGEKPVPEEDNLKRKRASRSKSEEKKE